MMMMMSNIYVQFVWTCVVDLIKTYIFLQERLLLSVLPEHVAAEIRDDLGSVVTGQFKKIYISRHENVSKTNSCQGKVFFSVSFLLNLHHISKYILFILFADIVGFTAISSTCSAVELVKILNELFARFDKLAEKFHQLRIKILGDCYYCISGAPVQREDHAVLSVHMGLSMVDAIKYVQEKTKSTVDMRVGIHTGSVLAGVMGQRQWQFDVYSRDVELANKMESGGLPGRVHISEKTLSFMNGEFEVCPGDGETREEAIRLAGIKTYLIVKVLKPYPQGTLDEVEEKNDGSHNNHLPHEGVKDCILSASSEGLNAAKKVTWAVIMDETSTEVTKGENPYCEGVIIEDEELCFPLNSLKILYIFNRKLYRRANSLTLSFEDERLEQEYSSSKEEGWSISVVSAPITFMFSSLAYKCILPVSEWQSLGYVILVFHISDDIGQKESNRGLFCRVDLKETFVLDSFMVFAVGGRSSTNTLFEFNGSSMGVQWFYDNQIISIFQVFYICVVILNSLIAKTI
ncbi:Adenylate cyclase type 3 [Nymphon striatum]|nr:Adenylate cyclase type 3 [Nymphon striatum]